ncbi:hypothetical protein PFFCH_00319 [Plasmodium falciparum FCH/4]|uniref:Duffy-binding-like domain-containing protein n=2 Tax=Plasmodium falciparum TaxID=5833 RepID=A0A024VU39_PLAFA|nr:hypothetical protein PFFCH_00319 [Plasmodium falciparum FCH/4]
MAPKAAAGSGGSTQDGAHKYKNAKDAKDLLDIIGKDVYETVKNESEAYKQALTGQLSLATLLGRESAHTTNPCGLDYSKLINGTGVTARGHPCRKDGKGEDVKRFSKERVDEYDEKKIRDTNKSKGGNNEGQCAPYRRLSLCNKNFQKINNYSSNAKHNLLVDVCLAAKHEGQSITRDYPKYRATYVDSPSEMCTMLARSFADIGDIIRGRDLYFGKRKKKKQIETKTETERDELENKLKEIFKEIHDDVTSTSGKQNGELKTRYQNENGGDFFQLREDWWALNRETVWKAITCDEEKKLGGYSYFRKTCGDEKGQYQAHDKCTCNNGDVPTYFDYVPQYLRWFEEWAEDFCTKRKHKLQNAKNKCRGKFDNQPRYCSRNGYDCEQTIYKKGYFVIDKGCINCLYACNPYVDWIDNQRKQFDKQVKKYDEEMKKYTNGGGGSGNRRQKRDATTTNYDGYESKFYEQLKKKNYENVESFLEKLNKEGICQSQPTVGQERASPVDFTKGKTEKTFSHTEYCQPCPLCGVERKGGNDWKEKNNGVCDSDKHYKIKVKAESTDINVLSFGDKGEDRETKLIKFCAEKNGDTTNGTGGNGTGGNGTGSGSSGGGAGGSGSNSNSKELYEEWKCYEAKHVLKVKNGEDDGEYDQEVENAGGLCILEKTNHEGVQKQKTFNPFFYYWVAHMLKDSIYWETQKIKKCLKKGTKTKCTDKCKRDCECFKKWVGKKREEWRKIVQHFKTQEAFKNKVENSEIQMLGGIMECPDFVLQYNLLEEFLKKDSTEDSSEDSSEDSQSRDEEAKEIKHLRQMLQQAGVVDAAGDIDVAALAGLCTKGAVAEQNTIMDKLLDYELTDAQTCLSTHTNPCPQPPKPEGPGATVESDSKEQEEEEDEEEEEEEEEEEGDGDNVDGAVEEKETETESKEATDTTTPPLDVCDTVAEALAEDNLTKACQQKYQYGKEKFPNWKCIPTKPNGDSTSQEGGAKSRVARSAPSGKDTGSVCVPPRRRRLYIQKLHEWANSDETTKAKSQVNGESSGEAPQGEDAASSTSSLTDATQLLRQAFIQSAAVETFFLWDRYKKIKEKEEEEKQAAQGQVYTQKDDNQEAQKELETGEIPEVFLRQMFYTLGDYRDICIGDDTMIKALEASGDKNIEKIEDKIKSVIEKSGDTPPPPKKNTPKDWWQQHAPSIWNGMICALTYKEDTGGEKGTPLKQDDNLKSALLDTTGKKPKDEYDYKTVAISSVGPSTGIKLEEFASRPTFVRWLEEWGEEFCRKQKHKLKIIEKDCRGDKEKNVEKCCDDDGFECKEMCPCKDGSFETLKCPSCAKSCKSYKKWIKTKKKEYEKQKQEYSKQKEKCEKESNKHDNGFCGILETTSSTAAAFLQKLGPCSKNDDDSVQDEIKFDDERKTFGHETYCKPCSQFKIYCKNCNSTVSSTNEKCNHKNVIDSITSEDIIYDKSGNGNIEMLVSDNDAKGFDGLQACEKAGIFKGFRKDQWKCGEYCGVDICTLKKNNNGERVIAKENDGKNQIIFIRVLFKRWLENFLEDYIKINAKISHCTKNGDKPICIKDCVQKWAEEKRKEWPTIRDRYINQYRDENSNEAFEVKSFLETLIPLMDLVNDKGKVTKLSQLDYSCGCSTSASSENGTQKDIIDCMIKKLETKATSCKQKHTPSGDTQPTCADEPPLEDEDEEYENEDKNDRKVGHPQICKGVLPETKPETEEKGDCEKAAAPGGAKKPKEEEPAEEPAANSSPSSESSEETNQTPPAPAPVAPPKKEENLSPPQNLFDNPAVIPALVTSTLAWSVGIGFATFTYFYLKKQ